MHDKLFIIKALLRLMEVVFIVLSLIITVNMFYLITSYQIVSFFTSFIILFIVILLIAATDKVYKRISEIIRKEEHNEQ